MGLRDIIDRAVGTAIRALDDIPEEVVYIEVVGNGAYDPAADTNSQDEVMHENITVTFMDFTVNELKDTAIRNTDHKVIIQQSILPASVDTGDRLRRSDGVEWRVVNYKQDPAHATWELQVRHGG